MNIVFQTLKLHNFLSFGEAELNLTNNGYTLISGENHNPTDLAKSNGSGKSTLWDAICWALTGETIRGVKDEIVNLYTTGDCEVELSFKIDNTEYVVCRGKGRKQGSNLKIYINGEDKSGKGIKDSNKLLAEYLPDLTSSLLGSVIILGQGLPQRFSNNKPSERKNILEKLSKSDFMINDIKEKLDARSSVLSAKLRAVEDEILSDGSKVHLYQSQLADFEARLANLEAPSVYQAAIDEATVKISELNQKIEELRKEVAEAQAQYDACRDMQVSLSGECGRALDQVKNTYEPSIAEYRVKKVQLDAEIISLQRTITKLESITDICPTCGQKLPDVHKPDTSAEKELLAKYREEVAALAQAIDELEEKEYQAVQEAKASYENRRIELVNQSNTWSRKIADINGNINIHLTNLNAQTNIQNNAKMSLEKLDSTRTSLTQSIQQVKDSITQLSNKIGYNNTERDQTKSRLDIINKMKNLASRDFRGYLLTNVITFIDKKAKEYAYDIFETDKISFNLEGNDINISYDGKSYENLSGGEKQKVDIIIQFAIRDMLCQFSNFTSNILVLDEVFDGLDSIGCQRVIDLIAKRLTDIESVFIITHHADIELPVDSVITVIKDSSGVSRIK